MVRPSKDEQREKRITYEIVVDCYNEIEVAMGWYYYLENNLDFPFEARITRSMRYNFLSVNDTVTVVSMAEEVECEESMWVTIQTGDSEFDLPLEQIEPIDSIGKAKEAVEDWRYWLDRGYQF